MIISQHRTPMAWLKNLALLAASLLCGLLLIESALRLMGWSFPIFMHPDVDLGWSHRPGIVGWSSHENTVYLRMNRFGFRGPDWPQQPATDTFRIAVIGDSFVESSHLPDEHSLTSLIESRLSVCPAFSDRHVEVLNFGVSGYGTAQEYLLLQRKVVLFHPNLVLLAIYVGNDVSDNIRSLSVENQKARPYFIELPSGELQLDTSFRSTDTFRNAMGGDWQKRLVNASYLLQALKQFYKKSSIIPAPIEAQDFRRGTVENKALPVPESSKLYSSSPDDIWLSAWSITEKLLLQMRDWSNQKSIEFELVIFPTPIQALPGEDMRRTGIEAFGLTDLDYPIERIAQFAAQNSIPHLNLLAPLRAYGDRERDFLYGFPPHLGNGHLNATGNKVSGELIADWLCRQLSPRRGFMHHWKQFRPRDRRTSSWARPEIVLN
jgi:lysophospholipase L1-like esterase